MPRIRKKQIGKVNVLLTDAQGVAVDEIMTVRGIRAVSEYVRQLIAKDITEFKASQYAARLEDPDYKEYLRHKAELDAKKKVHPPMIDHTRVAA